MVRVFGISLVLVAAVLIGAPSAQADENYGPAVPTRCQVEVPVHVAGKRIVIEANVSAGSGETVTGTVEITVATGKAARAARSSAGREVYRTTATYDGSTLRIEGPRLRPGQYVASMRFTPDAALYGSCTDTVGFRVGARRDVGGVGVEDDKKNGGSTGSGPNAGSLPNTGGPHLSLLFLGMGLVVGGGAVAQRSRRTA